jgi:hypothetical protein
MKVGDHEVFSYHLVQLVLLDNGNWYEDASNTSFVSDKALYPYEVSPCPNSGPF